MRFNYNDFPLCSFLLKTNYWNPKKTLDWGSLIFIPPRHFNATSGEELDPKILRFLNNWHNYCFKIDDLLNLMRQWEYFLIVLENRDYVEWKDCSSNWLQ